MKPNDAARLFTKIMLAQAGDIQHTGGAVPNAPDRYYIRFEWEVKDEPVQPLQGDDE